MRSVRLQNGGMCRVRAARDSTKFNYGARLRAPKKMTTQGGRVTTLRATPIRFPAGREPAPGGGAGGR